MKWRVPLEDPTSWHLRTCTMGEKAVDKLTQAAKLQAKLQDKHAGQCLPSGWSLDASAVEDPSGRSDIITLSSKSTMGKKGYKVCLGFSRQLNNIIR